MGWNINGSTLQNNMDTRVAKLYNSKKNKKTKMYVKTMQFAVLKGQFT